MFVLESLLHCSDAVSVLGLASNVMNIKSLGSIQDVLYLLKRNNSSTKTLN